jgi:hypothetical protein
VCRLGLPRVTANYRTQFAGVEEDELIPRHWLEKMDELQHSLNSNVKWDTGDVLLIDVRTPLYAISRDHLKIL